LTNPKADLQAAVALNGVGININRAIGPALAGLLIVGVGEELKRKNSREEDEE
jgi:hypothetical protein